MNKKEITVHLNFDDFHPQADRWGDFGGLGGDNLKKINDLLEEFPRLSITMFTVPNWIDAPYTHHRYWYFLRQIFRFFPVVQPKTEQPFLLRKHPKWCELVRGLVNSGKLEIAVHGYFHFNPFVRVHGQEFIGLNEETTRQRILLAEEEFAYNNISFVKVFRTPGWGRNKYLSKVLIELEYQVDAKLNSASQTHVMEKDSFGMYTLPQNWSIKQSPKEALMLAEKHGAVFMKGHLAYRYGKEVIENGITEEYWNNLRYALRDLENRYTVRYVSVRDLITHQK